MIKSAMLAASLLATANPALAASVLYGSDNDNIYTVDTASGLATLVGSNGLGGFDVNGYGSILRDLTSSATTLYGAKYTNTANGITGAVVTINPMTGAIVTTANLTGLLETGTNQGLYSIAFDRSTGVLYGNTAQRLYTINPVTGAVTLVGNLPTGRVVGLGVNAVTNALYAINSSTNSSGDAVFDLLSLSKINASVLTSVALVDSCNCDVAFDPLTNDGYVSSIFYDGEGSFLYSGLDKLNPALTGTSFVGQPGPAATFGFNGLAFLGVTGAVPEPESWALMIAGFGVAGAAMRRTRRRESLAAA